MPEPSVRAEKPEGWIDESAEFRRTHYRAYDADGFASSFALGSPESATLDGVTAYLSSRFRGTGGTGYDSKDLVILLGPRIVAVIRGGRDGEPVVTLFPD